MPTIDELMEGKQPGEIKIIHSEWTNIWFRPFFRAVNEDWFGLHDDGSDGSYAGLNYNDWELWTEPKKKVVRWLWARADCRVTDHMLSDEEIKMCTDADKMTKLEWSATEFDE